MIFHDNNLIETFLSTRFDIIVVNLSNMFFNYCYILSNEIDNYGRTDQISNKFNKADIRFFLSIFIFESKLESTDVST